jgi:hypothetical protein
MRFGNEGLVPMMTDSGLPCSASSSSVSPACRPLLIVQEPSSLTLGFV